MLFPERSIPRKLRSWSAAGGQAVFLDLQTLHASRRSFCERGSSLSCPPCHPSHLSQRAQEQHATSALLRGTHQDTSTSTPKHPHLEVPTTHSICPNHTRRETLNDKDTKGTGPVGGGGVVSWRTCGRPRGCVYPCPFPDTHRRHPRIGPRSSLAGLKPIGEVISINAVESCLVH